MAQARDQRSRGAAVRRCARARAGDAEGGRSRVCGREQRATHGLAWLATYVEAVRQLTAYADACSTPGCFTEIEELIVRSVSGEYLAQIQGGIPISQARSCARPTRPSAAAVAARLTPDVEQLIARGNTRSIARAWLS